MKQFILVYCILTLFTSYLIPMNLSDSLVPESSTDSLQNHEEFYQQICNIQKEIAAITENCEAFASPLVPMVQPTQYQKDRALEYKMHTILKEKKYEDVEDFARILARNDEYDGTIKRIVANYLCDTSGRNHYVNPADAAQSASDYETDENSVMFLVPRSHQVDSELSQFVSKHHTSVATLHNLYPERIISSKESFYIRAAGLRSLDGLASVSNRYHFPHSQKRAHAGVRYVCFDKNYLQNLYVQEIKNVFPYVTTIHCDENPLHSIDLKGARLGNTFSLKSIAHDVTIDLDSLSDLPPINLHLNKNSLSAEHAAAL